ncbi:rho GTPase-activating protein 11A [Amyelois transitella]|uniref:rho GTPase-activating protein 11A n=1 Tax=Amyelois transitella TaxID=680683 RepID=UPI00299047F2|nr:rho GTPase-activating protein 11A [Amyelois transitella]
MLISDGINHGKLQSIIVGELKKAGLKHRLKKIISKNVKDHKTLFGAPLVKVPSCSVICCGSTLSVPIVVTEMSSVLRANAHVEGLFRKAGSQNRQKDIKRLLDAGGCVSDGHHPIDVASVLKLYLRGLPEPLISAEVQDLLLRCRLTAGEDALKPVLDTLLLLPVLHVHLLHYIMELLNYIASRHKENLMDSSNLAIVMAPSIMPLPAAASAQRLEHHVALVKIFIENSHHIGLLTEDLMTQLDDDSDVYRARRKKRRSGSLNRVLSGLRKIVSGSVNTPATVRETTKTPVLSKSAAKRKFDTYEGFSAKMRKEIKQNLPQKELSFTPMKMGVTDRKRLRLSMVEARSTPVVNCDFSGHKNSETSVSSEDMLTSSDHLFSAHDTIDLSPDMKQADKDYVRISKQEYEEIKSRVSAIENRLSREFTDVIPRVEPLQQVQDVYEQTLEEVAMLNCPNSDHLARRLSKELKIRPNEEAKIIRSPSARKIGSIRRRSKENITKIVRHKSWNASSQSHNNQTSDRFYPYIGLRRRDRTSTAKPDLVTVKPPVVSEWDSSENSLDVSQSSNQKYHLRKRISLASDFNLDKTIGKLNPRRSLNVNISNSWENTVSDNSMNNTMNSSSKSINSSLKSSDVIAAKNSNKFSKPSPQHSQHKWRNAAAFFMDKTGELESGSQSGRPSVNKLRKQNAGAVLAKAKLFESSSDKSSEVNDRVLHNGFARRPRANQQRPQKLVAQVRPKVQANVNIENVAPNIPDRVSRNADVAPNVPSRVCRPNVLQGKDIVDTLRVFRKTTPPAKKVVSPQSNMNRTAQTPTMKKSLATPRSLRIPNVNGETRKPTPLRAMHISPRRRSPRQKLRLNQAN